jgi:hypothetical protein
MPGAIPLSSGSPSPATAQLVHAQLEGRNLIGVVVVQSTCHAYVHAASSLVPFPVDLSGHIDLSGHVACGFLFRF